MDVRQRQIFLEMFEKKEFYMYFFLKDAVWTENDERTMYFKSESLEGRFPHLIVSIQINLARIYQLKTYYLLIICMRSETKVSKY